MEALSRRFAEGFDSSLTNLGTLLKVFSSALSNAGIVSSLTCANEPRKHGSTRKSPENLQQSAEVYRTHLKTFSKVACFATAAPRSTANRSIRPACAPTACLPRHSYLAVGSTIAVFTKMPDAGSNS